MKSQVINSTVGIELQTNTKWSFYLEMRGRNENRNHLINLRNAHNCELLPLS